MNQKLKLIILLDDNNATNYIHKKFIKESECTENCIDFQNGELLLDYLKSEDSIIPELLFMDINMPTMNAWEFLEEFEKIKNERLKKIVIILLSTSLSPSDDKIAKSISTIKEVQIKPLTVDSINKTVAAYF